ncbi:hypothetical protein QQP08_009389 [Theobroma cacao]|nr:hypothetical protein QQP08_009389 [Theobroma cacao]
MGVLCSLHHRQPDPLCHSYFCTKPQQFFAQNSRTFVTGREEQVRGGMGEENTSPVYSNIIPISLKDEDLRLMYVNLPFKAKSKENVQR